MFEELGCHVMRADEVGHEVLLPGGEAYQPVVAAFRNGRCWMPQANIDRKQLATEVFRFAGAACSVERHRPPGR